ncbi:hypothetical protein AAMO2058_001541300 [Amorphochlora amoebiformis]|uniref:Calponin-homology (CH) domain-containing protein n=1 Tax=Amorphochlora amoebiformis TaxID=1561963 RepID=A0A7S0CYF7_9EUKA|mmetsp:Transcript_15823/g.25053  ORF Transcript_15823/g.25053 Transcript_15823/m.25053 type:complete len:693 (+) Transcript_15823:12-2090(+)
MDASVVEWVNSFETISSKCKAIEELGDGVLLYSILSFVEEKHFPGNGISEDCKNEAQKQRNLERLSACLELFFEDIMGESQILEMDFHEIASGNKGEIMKLAEFVILATVQSEKKDLVVKNIMNMEEENQQNLMVICENMMQRLNSGNLAEHAHERMKSDHDEDTLTPEKSFDSRHNGSYALLMSTTKNRSKSGDLLQDERLHEENEKLRKEIEELRGKVKILQLKHAKADEKIQALEQDLEHQQSAKSVMERPKAQDSKLSDMKRELTIAKHEKAALADKVAEITTAYESLQGSTTPQISSMKKRIEKLQDELDMAKEKIQDYEIVNSKLGRYKQRLSQMGDVHKQWKDAEAAHTESLQRVLDLEEKLLEIPSLREKLKAARTEIDTKTLELEKHKSREGSSIQKLQQIEESKERSDEEKRQLLRKIEFLEEQVRSSAAQINEEPLGGVIMDDFSADSGSKEKVMRLEREVSKLKKQLSESKSEALPGMKELKEQLRESKDEIKALKEINLEQQGRAAPDKEQEAKIKHLEEKLRASEEEVMALKEINIEQQRQASEKGDPAKIEELKTTLRRVYDELKVRNDELQRAKEIEAAQKNALEELQRNSPRSQSFELLELQRQLKQANAMERKLVEKLRIQRDNYKKEQLLISNAFYTIGLEAHNMHIRSYERETMTGRSWLARQRAKLQKETT